MSKKVWFAKPLEYSPESQDFKPLHCSLNSPEDSKLLQYSSNSSRLSQYSSNSSRLSQYSSNSSRLSQYSSNSSRLSQYSSNSSKLSQYSSNSSKLSFISQDFQQDLSQYSMDNNTTTETYSTNDSQEISSSQQDSTDGQYGYDDANSTSSVQDEAVNSAIMEVSGELMLGKLSPHKQISGGSESSDISDDETRRATAGGSIAKYPESSTGLSDNDWNPYATESDTNQTPRSPRSTTSDDQNRVGFVSRATFNVGAAKDRQKESTATVSMTTGEVIVGPNPSADRVIQQDGQWQISRSEPGSQADRIESSSQRLDMLRLLVDKEAQETSPRADEDMIRSPDVDVADAAGLGRERSGNYDNDADDRESRESPETVKSVHSDGTLSSRHSLDSRKSEEPARDSMDSDRGLMGGRVSGDFDQDGDTRRQSAESATSRQSVESYKSAVSNVSDGQSVDSQQSQRSERSDQSQRSTGRSSDRSERLDRFSESAGIGMKDVIKFENAQRMAADRENKENTDPRLVRDTAGSPVTRMRLTAKLQPYTATTSRGAEEAPALVGKTGYISIAERERLLSESPDNSLAARPGAVPRLDLDRPKPVHSSINLSKFSEVERSPSEVSMRRVSNLFEETKQAARAAVCRSRPEPSGSEERFPLKDRMDHSIHEASLMAQDNRKSMERQDALDVKRSLNSEEVAKVLGKYSDDDGDVGRRSKYRYSDDISPGVSEPTYSRAETDSSYVSASSRETANSAASQRIEDESEDDLAKRVRAILSESDNLRKQTSEANRASLRDGDRGKREYVPHTIDYNRLERDLEEIQDSLQEVPLPKANDSLHLAAVRDKYSSMPDRVSPPAEFKSLESTSTTLRGRESGASMTSEAGQRLVWDHGADLQYDTDYDGKFIGTTTSLDTVSSRMRYETGSSDDMVVRPISSASNDTDRDVADLESTGTRTLTGTDISRAEKLVQQVLKRQPEGDLKENVEDIIARYRNERQDMYDRLRVEPEVPEGTQHAPPPEIPGPLKKPELYIHDDSAKGKENPQGLAERVYRILNSDKEVEVEYDNKGMAKEVYKILTKEPPHQQVNGILTQTTVEENEMLKKMVAKPKELKDDSSMDDSGLNGSGDSFRVEDRDIRKQLEWSQMSSPDKTGISDLASIRRVTSAPYSSVNNVKSLLSSQLQKVTQRNFDKSVELRTPYRQAIDCYPVYGYEAEPASLPVGREAWPARDNTGTRSTALASERFYLTDRDQAPVGSDKHQRTHSDPFDVSPSRRTAGHYRDGHVRSRSEEATSPSDLSQYGPLEYSMDSDRPTRSKARTRTSDDYITPKLHRAQARFDALRASTQSTASTLANKTTEWRYECYTSDSSEPCCHSDRSDGRGQYYHGYQQYANTKMLPKTNESAFSHPKTSHLTVHTTNFSVDGLSDEDSPCCGNDDVNHSPLKKQRAVRQSRAKTRYSSPSGKKSEPKSRSLPARGETQGGWGQYWESPISRDDVYELLSRSQKQEEKLHELRSKLLHHELNQSSVEGHSVSTDSDLSNHGDTRTRPPTYRSPKRHLGKRQGYMRRDGSPSPTESDTSGSRKGSRLRPYRPTGTRDMFYTESGDDTNESATTIESTHPGSDDAVPPYIPRQFLGTRQDEPSKHTTGIYGKKDRDDLSTIDENSLKDEREKALSISAGSNKSNPSRRDDLSTGRKSPSAKSDSGLGSTAVGRDSRDVYNPSADDLASRSRSPYTQQPTDPSRSSADGYPKEKRDVPLERPGFKTREEFQREFEERERILQEELARYRKLESRDKDPLGTSTRSDPGSVLEPAGTRWEYRETEPSEFRQLEPEPMYPQERLLYSRSKSDTDLVALSPNESQKYSSPMQPGTKFMELSTQPSPIFSHHDSVTYQPQPRSRQAVPQELPRAPAPTDKTPRHTETQDLPRVDDRPKAVPRAQRSSPVDRPLDPSSVRPMEPVELGADPRRMGGVRRTVEEKSPREKTPSPIYTRQKEMERELESLNKQLTDQVTEIQGAKEGQGEGVNFEDNFPPSKKAQVLREVLEQEYQDNVPANINDMWLRFKDQREQSMTESSLNSTRMDALSGLLENPTRHTVNKSHDDGMKDKEEEEDKQKENETRVRRLSEEQAVEQRSMKRQELKQRSGLSEEESNGSYTELLMDAEKKKAVERIRKGAKREDRKEKGKDRNTQEIPKSSGKSRKSEKEKLNEKASVTDIRSRNVVNTQHSDTMDTLFSIPEDASFEQSPTKAESDLKARQKRHRHVIDPLMKKLRDKIKLQRVKIDKERRKELQRMEKLKKLQMLLTAKKGGKLSDKAIDVELENVSTTSSFTQSESSHFMSDSTLTVGSIPGESDLSAGESTMTDTVNSTPIKLQAKKYPQDDFVKRRPPVIDTDSTETSDFSNIVVERVRPGKVDKTDRKSSGKKKTSKSKKSKENDEGQKVRKEKKKKEKNVYGGEVSEEDLIQQFEKYKRHRSPDGRRQRSTPSPPRQRPVSYDMSPEQRKYLRNVQDASTMYPSPITVSPPSRRRMRDVLMRSEAVQTSPSIRSSSPSHAYDEVPVAPVPVMSRARSTKKRPSPSPPRSAPVLQTKSYKSPVRSRQTTPRHTSQSPPRRKASRSPSQKMQRPGRIIQKPADESIWKVETEMPPTNSMFTPESPITGQDLEEKPGQAWFIPMKGSKPWQQSSKKRQAFSVRQESWEPKSVSQSTWKTIVHGNVLKDKEDLNDTRDTKFDLDPDGQPIRDENELSDSEVSDDEKKPLSKMSLQEAFLAHRQMVVSRVRQRQKRLNLAAEERKMQVFLQQEREKLFQEERRKEANPEAHPYSDNLHRPARRVITKEEMKEITEKKYKKLPEVLEREKMKKRTENYSLNRLKARLFNRRIQKRVLEKADKWGR